MSENQVQDCPYCDNQGFFVEGERHPIYDSDESGYPVLVGFHETAVQVQCEFCWTNPLSVFNATNNSVHPTVCQCGEDCIPMLGEDTCVRCDLPLAHSG